ncbi:MAG: AIR synthase-related protein, partial [Candidatus Subteraquimicrobiales bacterium]|nr:AIR synthase-related protein [Candidatus Subteraquimicrobiales bacterium]
ITGGGFVENIPRILPKSVDALIDLKTWRVPPIFKFIQKLGEIELNEMFKTFNMGIGMILIVTSEEEEKAMNYLNKSGEKVFKIGEVISGEGKVRFVND